jgi:hypothetical protein
MEVLLQCMETTGVVAQDTEDSHRISLAEINPRDDVVLKDQSQNHQRRILPEVALLYLVDHHINKDGKGNNSSFHRCRINGEVAAVHHKCGMEDLVDPQDILHSLRLRQYKCNQ